MHQICASQPRAEAKFFLLQTELHFRYIQGLDRFHFGRKQLANNLGARDDNLATSLQPSVSPGTSDVQAPGESQGRGFEHTHAKGHGIVGPTLRWLRNTLREGGDTLADVANRMRASLSETAAL